MLALAALARFEDCRTVADEVATLIEHLGARRFEQVRLLQLGHAALAEGRQAQAIELLQQALDVARASAPSFWGPAILGALALARADSSRDMLAEAEEIISAGCVGHNQLRFYTSAMQLALEVGDHGEVERYAAALENFARFEPLPWSDFFIARARMLAAFGQGRRDAVLTAELERLRNEGERLGLETALLNIRSALAGDTQGAEARRRTNCSVHNPGRW